MTGPETHGSAPDPLQALRDELAGVAPSPEFAARVRQELDVVGRQQTSWWGWGGTWLGVAAAVVVLAIGVVSTFRPGTNAPAVKMGNHSPELPAPFTSQPEREIAQASEDPRTPPEHPRTPEPEHLSTRAPENPSLLVLTNQPAVLRALWARARAQAGALVEVSAPSPPDRASEIVVAPIEVNPIVVPWLVESPAAPGSSPIIR